MSESTGEKIDTRLTPTEAANSFLSNWGEALLVSGGLVIFGGGITETFRLSLKYLGEGRPDQALFGALLGTAETLAVVFMAKSYINEQKSKKNP